MNIEIIGILHRRPRRPKWGGDYLMFIRLPDGQVTCITVPESIVFPKDMRKGVTVMAQVQQFEHTNLQGRVEKVLGKLQDYTFEVPEKKIKQIVRIPKTWEAELEARLMARIDEKYDEMLLQIKKLMKGRI